jgi:hypothetical protein
MTTATRNRGTQIVLTRANKVDKEANPAAAETWEIRASRAALVEAVSKVNKASKEVLTAVAKKASKANKVRKEKYLLTATHRPQTRIKVQVLQTET